MSSPKSYYSLLFLFSVITLTGCASMFVGVTLISRNFTPLQFTAKRELDPTVTATMISIDSRQVNSTLTVISTTTSIPTETPIPYETKVNLGDQAEMIQVPAGEFRMGSDANSDPYFWGAEGPQHIVYLNEYYIYQKEVTNGMYQACVSAKACPRPAQIISATREQYYGSPEFDDYPVIYVTWVGAVSYCKWAGANLPTEAQWEKAARGTESLMFPWGDNSPTATLAIFNASDTAKVGSLPEGASPYGIFDMSGNVLEWVFDRFQAGFYSASPLENPVGPADGNRRVIRGGAWHHSDVSALRTVARASMKENYTGNDIGFRCAMPLP
jgi:eukaryotic-like serine/threonine-protein kinase